VAQSLRVFLAACVGTLAALGFQRGVDDVKWYANVVQDCSELMVVVGNHVVVASHLIDGDTGGDEGNVDLLSTVQVSFHSVTAFSTLSEVVEKFSDLFVGDRAKNRPRGWGWAQAAHTPVHARSR
jgi:hypothetical protein